MDYLIVALAFAVIGIGGGWYLKSRFGAKVAADVAAVKDTAAKL